jgi:hypothetical protein|tara:strand:- start:200 stop:802 length:603 start_codon:yes stop_codon:yes gene_type:complete
MKADNHMNYLALNQNILNKSLVIGRGFKEGDSETPATSFCGFQVYLNGKHKMPEHENLDKGFIIGSMTHPYAMMGMPNSSGELSYEFWVTEKEYIIIVRLKLDEFDFGDSEPAADILSLVKKDEMPKTIEKNKESHTIICQEMMMCHLESLFEFYKNLEDLNEWSFEDDTLYSHIKYYFKLKNNIKVIDDELKNSLIKKK